MFSLVVARSNKSATKFIRDSVRARGRYFSEVANTQQRKKLVILGTGWAGFRCLLDVGIHSLNPRNHFLFTPLLTSTTVGTLEFRGIIEPVRTARKRVNYAQASCTNIDFANSTLEAESYYPTKDSDVAPEYKPHFQMKYDELVISVGALPNTFKIPGVEKYCFFLKQLSDARAIRQRILECFERASNPTTPIQEKQRLLHFVVIGGGPTSVEFTAELHDFLKQDVHKWFPELEPYVKITLVEASKTLLSTFDASLRDYTMRLFKKRAIDVRVGVAVKEVQRHVMLLNDGTEFPFGLAVWSTGLAPTSFVNNMPVKKDKTGRIIVDNFCRIKEPSLNNVYAIGDCANFEEFTTPPTAQAAEQEGKYIAKLLNDKAHQRELKPFIYHYQGMLAYVGGWRALADLPFFAGSGFLTWLFWNAAYITKLVSLKNKVMIPMYWFKSFVFGRDIARF